MTARWKKNRTDPTKVQQLAQDQGPFLLCTAVKPDMCACMGNNMPIGSNIPIGPKHLADIETVLY